MTITEPYPSCPKPGATTSRRMPRTAPARRVPVARSKRDPRILMHKGARYTVPSRLLAIAAAHAASDASALGFSIAQAVDFTAAFHGVEVPAGPSLGEAVEARLTHARPSTADEFLDAVWHAVSGRLGQRVSITGWIAGQRTLADGDHRRFVELTGAACPQCGVNPVCHGADRARLRCLDAEGCGWHNADDATGRKEGSR